MISEEKNTVFVHGGDIGDNSFNRRKIKRVIRKDDNGNKYIRFKNKKILVRKITDDIYKSK